MSKDKPTAHNEVLIEVNGAKYHFRGNELISPEQEAILFLTKLDEEEREF